MPLSQFRTPLNSPEMLALYERATGAPFLINSSELAVKYGYPSSFRRRGWWGRKETLRPPLFPDVCPLPEEYMKPSVTSKAILDIEDDSALAVLLTGRHLGLQRDVEKILRNARLNFARVYCNDNKHDGTDAFKEATLYNLLDEYPSITEVTWWDDRHEHFRRWYALKVRLTTGPLPRLSKFTLMKVTGDMLQEVTCMEQC